MSAFRSTTCWLSSDQLTALADRGGSRSGQVREAVEAYLFPKTPPPLYRFCAYCGRGCIGVACKAHRDLLRLDPSSPLAGTP